MALARHSPFHRAGHERPAGASSDAGADRRGIQSAAGVEFLVWVAPADVGAGTFPDGLLAAVGPEGVLGNQSSHEYHGHHPSDWTAIAAAGAGWLRVWSSHFDTVFRVARRRSAWRDRDASY